MIGIQKASGWKQALEDRDPGLLARLEKIYGADADILESRRKLCLQAVETFIGAYGPDRDVLVSRAPGRINLLGNHIEHRGGFVNYLAINRDTFLVASGRQDDRVVMHNANPGRFPSREFQIGRLLPPHQRGDWLHFIQESVPQPGNWDNYIAAAALGLQDRFADRTLVGMDLAVAGDIPIAAGLSSSSALVVSALEALLHFNNLDIPREEKAEFCGRSEWYVGTRGGAGDHAAMLYGRHQAILHLQFFPLTTEEVPFPDGYRVVACNSFVEHQSRSIFNERIATYEIGLMLVKEKFPHYADKLAHLRDLNAEHLNVAPAEIYRILKALPERATRDEIRAQLPQHANKLKALFAPHDEPRDGYLVRQVVLFGLAECARGARCADLLKAGDLAQFGRLKYLSHDGDRRVRFERGKPTARDNRTTDAHLDRLIADLEHPSRVEAAQIHLQPGGYDCSCEELDLLVDLARNADGVIGAGLTGGGLGGCVLVIVEADAVNSLIRTLEKNYYQPRKRTEGTIVCASVDGSGLI